MVQIFFITGKFGIVYKAHYVSEENKTIEVAVKIAKRVLLILS